jgi:uncharacterized Fe-S center protein
MEVFESIESVPLPRIGEDDVVAIKLHMGERGNPSYIRPQDVKTLVSRVRASGADVFITDTTTLYQRQRSNVQKYLETAQINGFTEDYIDAPVVIADAEGGERRGNIYVAKGLLTANVLLVLSHATGHITAGFAAAIKNVAMGCVGKPGKRYIHSAGWPRYNRDSCEKCGECAEACPFGFIELQEEGLSMNLRDCPACERCLGACEYGGLFRPPGAMVECYRRYAETFKAVVSCFDRVFFINELKRITRFCDCSVDPGPRISPDVGFLAGEDAIELDRLSAEIIMKSPAGREALEPKWGDFIYHFCRFV